VGNKARNLRRLADKGFCIPLTWVIPWEAYLRYLADDITLIQELQQTLNQVIQPKRLYAVRSSADIEDTLERSYAGQFKTVLNVRGVDNVLQAIWQVWATAKSFQVDEYRQKLQRNDEPLHMAVILQEMVKPVVSGVAFSCNPLTGIEEVVVEAVQGEGTFLVQEGITPQRWVNRRGVWLEQPESPYLPLQRVTEIAEGVQKISRAFKQVVDTEWVFDGERLFWIQVREITGLKTVNIYSNRMAREMIPGIVKPLIWSVNIPLVNTVWVRLLAEMVGDHGIQPEDLAKSFYYRAYFNTTTLARIFDLVGMPPDVLERMMGILPPDTPRQKFRLNPKMIKHIPRLIGFIWDKLNFERKINRHFPKLREGIYSFEVESVGKKKPEELLAEIDRLFTVVQRLAYFNVVGPLLMSLYHNLFTRSIRRMGIAPEEFDEYKGMEDIRQYDPNTFLQSLRQHWRTLPEETRQRLQTCTYEEFQQMDELGSLRDEVSAFLKRFGHLSDSGNDFSAVPWRENPTIILRLLEIDHKDSPVLPKTVDFDDLPVRGIRRALLKFILRRAQYYRAFREQISSLYTYGYGLFRPCFLAIADHFIRQGWLKQREDIFYLEFSEIRQAILHPEQAGEVIDQKPDRRKAEIASLEDMQLPAIIYGEQPPPAMPMQVSRLKGTPTSQGYYRGPVKVVKGLEDFHKVQQGDVLVVPFTDVGWTPLFARAGAVVAESGGILSHSSIIAREYHIPAVVSVQGATLLKDGMLVAVDGYQGEVLLLDISVEGVKNENS